jgi:serine/threonine-protein kinase
VVKVGDLLASKYRVARVVGEGGMGVVVEAYHELLDQRVAVKLLYADVADREAKERLLLEARSAAKLQSDHVARVVDVDVGPDGLPFIVMELLEGSDLSQIADARGALPRWLVVDYMLQALEGLAHAHGRGIVHRDLKPSNLYLANRPDGTQIIKILDFGISKSQGPVDRRAKQLTGGMTVLGSPPYMSPEQVRTPKSVDHRTDIWSLGISMYELLTNAMPFGGEEIQETFAQILELEAAPIRSIVTGVPEGLERVVMKCLAKNRDERFADVGELARALAPFGSGSWSQSVDRIQATLVRTAQESAASLSQVAAAASGAASSRKLDSLQPEFHGTASTVAHRFGVFESKKRVILGICALFMSAGVVLIGSTVVRHRSFGALFQRFTQRPLTDERSEPAAPAAEVPVPVLTGVPVEATPPTPPAMPTVVTVSVENELPSTPVPTATFIGASPLPPPGPASASPSASAAKPRKRTALPPAVASGKAASPGLPPGLPQNRSGQ